MRPSLSERIKAGQAVGCLWLSSGTPAIAELARDAGVGAVVFDVQHGLWERASLEWGIGLLRDTPALVRVARNAPELIGAALDAGACGVIVPLVNTAQEAAAAVAAAHFPPHGIRSGGGIRPLRALAEYVERAAAETLVCVMIETQQGVENIDEIVRTPGVDLVFIGPGDLGLSFGVHDVAALEDAVMKVRDACATAGLACGIYCFGPEAAAERIRQGFRLVTIGDDIGLLRRGLAGATAAFEKGLRHGG